MTKNSPLVSFSWFYYLKHVRKRFWLVGLITLIGVGVGAIQVAKTRPLYRASARVLVKQNVMSDTVVPIHDPYVASQVQSTFHRTQVKLLTSRSLAREVITSLQLERHPEYASVNAPRSSGGIQRLWVDPHVHTLRALVVELGRDIMAHLPPDWFEWLRRPLEKDVAPRQAPGHQTPAAPEDTPANQATLDSMRQASDQANLANAFLRRLKVQSDIDSNLIHLRFTAHNAELAALVPNTLAQLYMKQVEEKRFEEAHEGLKWLQKRVEEMEEKVERAEIELERYRQAHNTYSVDGLLPGVMQQLVAVNTELAVAQTERINSEVLYRRAQESLDRPRTLQELLEITEETELAKLHSQLGKRQYDLTQLAQRYGSEHPQVVKLKTDIEAHQRQIEAEHERLLDLAKSRYEVAQAREAALLARHDELKREVLELNEKAIRYGRLKRKLESHERLATALIDRLGETDLKIKMVGELVFELVDAAEIPTQAINYKPVRTMSISGMVALVVAVGIAAGLGYFDDRLETPDDTEYLGFPVIGNIIRHRRAGAVDLPGPKEPLVMLEDPDSPTAEAYRMLRTNVLFSYADPPRKSFLITSAHQNEGKTTVSANLAVAISQMDFQVLLVEADLRNPSIHKMFELDGMMGLSELLRRDNFDNHIQPYRDNLSIIPAGERPPNPAELLGSKRMQTFLSYAREKYDVLLIDTPPILAVSDALMLSRLADGVLMVIRSNVTSYDHARRAISQLLTLQTHAPMPIGQAGMELAPSISLGLVMNFLDPRAGQTYGYYGNDNHYYLNAPKKHHT